LVIYPVVVFKKISDMPAFQDYRRLFEESPTPMFVYGIPGYRFLAVNESALTQYGYTLDDFLGLTALDIRPASEVPAFLQADSAKPDAFQSAGKFLHCNRQGEVFWVKVITRGTVFMGQNAVLVLAINIDDQVRAQQALAEKTRETKNILESITDGFFTLDREWRFLYVNKETERVAGYAREELIGRNAWELFPGGRDSIFYTEYTRVIKEQVSAHFEAWFGELAVWVQVNAYPSGNGIAVYFRDVTKTKKTEEQVFNEQQNLMAIINNTHDIIWSVDRHNHIISDNIAFWKRVAQIVGKPVADLNESDYNSESYAGWIPYFQTALSGEAFTIIREENRDGKWVYEEVSFNPIYDRNGGVSGVSCFLRDVTPQREYLQKIEKQNRQLKEIAWMQSHRIRKHVANILGLTSLLNVESPGDNPQLLRNLQLTAMQLDEVIKEISSLSRGERDQLLEKL
jgi:PAS domain S-box-containing protein